MKARTRAPDAHLRSTHWPAVEHAQIKAHPCCEVCSVRKGLAAHHVIPFHVDPTHELDPENLITLCHDHHFLFGHFRLWKSWNVDVRADAALWAKRIAARPLKA